MVRRNDFQKRGSSHVGNYQGPRNQNRPGVDHKNNNEQRTNELRTNEPRPSNENKAGSHGDQSGEAKRQVNENNMSKDTKEQRESKEQRETREHREPREYRDNREHKDNRDGSQQRNNYNRSYSNNSRYSGKLRSDETVEDIVTDITRIEKEIDLEIKEISSMRLGI